MFKIKRVPEPKFSQGFRYELWQLRDGSWICLSDKEPSLFTAEIAMARHLPTQERFYDKNGRLVEGAQ